MSDLLSLLKDVSGGVEGADMEEEIIEDADLDTPEDAEIENDETPEEELSEDEAQEIYSKVTLAGLKKYRPDLVREVAPTRSRSTTTRTRGESKKTDPVGDYNAYLAEARKLLQEDESKVSGRRLTFLCKKFINAMASKGATVPATSEPEFVISQGDIKLVWGGPEVKIPEGIEI